MTARVVDADQARKRRHEAPEVAAAARRFARALAKRAEEGDTEALEGLVALAAEVDASIGRAARSLHSCGYSWTDIARTIGVSRQAARQRFAQPTNTEETA